MSNLAVKCRRGDRIDFAVRLIDRWPDGIPAEYTLCVFELREIGDETTDALLSVDQSDCITIDHDASMIDVSVGATATDGLPIAARDRELFGQVRLKSSGDPDNAYSWVIPRVVLRPNGVPL